MKDAILLAKRLHLRMLYLSVFKTNFPGLKLYRNYGFVENRKVRGGCRTDTYMKYSCPEGFNRP